MVLPDAPPLRIDILTPDGGGLIGMTSCPGRIEPPPAPPRVLATDLDRVVATGAGLLVSLIETHEFEQLGVASLGADIIARGLAWEHLPIRDFGVPDLAFETAWVRMGPDIHARLDAGGGIVIHCRGGLGRTGTIAARLLVERGMETEAAIALVRSVRPGTIETPDQLRHISGITSGSWTARR